MAPMWYPIPAGSRVVSTLTILAGGCGSDVSIPFDVACESMVYSAESEGGWSINTLSGDNGVKITEDDESVTPTWSPDGEPILFTSDRDGDFDL